MASYSDNPLRHAFFFKLNFASSPPYYVWQGFRPLTIGATTWQPVGPMATIDVLEDAVADQVPQIVLKLSGVEPDLLSKALASTSEIRQQLAFVNDAFFDENWQPGPLSSFAVLRMDNLRITQNRNQDGSWDRVIAVNCENFLTNGPNPPYGRYSSEDQWARLGSNTDKYFSYMAINQNRRQRWPTY